MATSITATIELTLEQDDLRRIAKFMGLRYEFATVETVQRFAREEVENAIRELGRK